MFDLRSIRLVILLLIILPCDSIADSCPGEISRAQASVRYFNENWPLRTGDEITAYIKRLGNLIVQKAIPNTSFQWRFIVARNDAINAMALGDGNILVNDGVISALDNESEVAAILAHEMSHQIAGHLCTLPKVNFFSSLIENQDNSLIKQGLFTQVYNHDREIEADRMAVEILKLANYNPFAMLHVLKTRANSNPNTWQNERMSALRQLLDEGSYKWGKKSQLDNIFNSLKQITK